MTNDASVNVLEVEDLTVDFSGFQAVKGVSFEVAGGEVVGILGSNGAGKSSTMKVLSGVLKPTTGSVRVDGHELGTIAGENEAKRLTGYCPDVGGLVVGATPRAHVQLLLSLEGREKDYEKGLYLIEKFGLSRFIDTRVGGFSHGMSRRLSVLLAVLASKKLLILDEPFDGVDPEGEDAIADVVREAKKAGLAVIVCTHRLDLLTMVSDRVVVMSEGQVVDRVTATELEGPAGAARYREILRESKETGIDSSLFAHISDEEAAVANADA